MTQTGLGKGFAGTMLGLPVVALALAAADVAPRRAGAAGSAARRASCSARVYTLVLGLGGWFAGVVVVLLAFPTVPLDDVLLAVLSIGVPIGLGVYLAALDRSRPQRARLRGRARGALVGAWLGFQAGTGLLAVVTTIVGAALGANLAVLVLDIRRDRAPATVEAPRAAFTPASI